MSNLVILGASGLAALLVGLAAGVLLLVTLSRGLRAQARRDAEAMAIQARAEAHHILNEARHSTQVHREALREASDAELRREENLLREYEIDLTEREKLAASREDQGRSVEARLDIKQREIESIEREATRLHREAEARARAKAQRLEKRASLTHAEGVELRVCDRVEKAELRARRARAHLETWARENSVGEARRVMGAAVERYNGVGHLERIQNTIPMPDKRTLLALATPGEPCRQVFDELIGCELVVDEQAVSITVRGDDPLGREICRRVLRQLANRSITAPDRVRAIAEHVQGEVDREVQNAARKATRLLGVGRMHPEIMHLVGRLKFRLSYSQNQWKHAIEVAYLAGMLAEELGEDVRRARRGGLLHDIGKAMTHDHEGSHAVLGAEVARRCGEHELVANAIGSHHNDEPPASPIALLVAAADALSGARPGARREHAASYMGRIAEIQRIATSFAGVERVDIMHAGREVRVTVTPDERGELPHRTGRGEPLTDAELHPLAEDIARTIEEEMTYAGQIRVTVIRESRSVAIAH